jgi:subtilisin family serine protease
VGASNESNPELIPGQYIITFADSVSDVPGLAKRIAAQYGHEPMFTYTSAIKGFAAELPDQAIDALQHNPQIERIEQDAVIGVSDTQAPPGSWGLDQIDQRTLTLDNSYSYANSGAGVTVYILDTGIRTTHVDFGGRASTGFSAITDAYSATDCNGHGTHVAGTAGSKTFGVAKAVTLISVRVLGCDGSGPTSGVVAGVDWVTKNRALPAVANMSLGGSSSSILSQAVQNSIGSGVVYAVAAGNSAIDACNVTPANVTAALTVGASNQLGSAESYSNYGKCVDLYAPGRMIYSTWYTSDSASTVLGGTSMASPHVAGVAALYLAAHPSATTAEATSAIVSGATPGLLSGVPVGTANLLLYSLVAGGSVPSDTTTTPTGGTSSPTSPDSPPVASFTSSCPHGKCSFDASSSSDDHGIVSYAWSFGDGSSANSASLVKTAHTYTAAGTYTVTLTVTDGTGQSRSKSATLVFKKL